MEDQTGVVSCDPIWPKTCLSLTSFAPPAKDDGLTPQPGPDAADAHAARLVVPVVAIAELSGRTTNSVIARK